MSRKICSIVLVICMLLSVSAMVFANATVAENEKEKEFEEVVKTSASVSCLDKEAYAKILMGLEPDEEFPLVKTTAGKSYFDVDKYLESVEDKPQAVILTHTKEYDIGPGGVVKGFHCTDCGYISWK